MPTNHGSRAAFSTGSQPQKPPHPRTSYDHQAPSRMPMVKKAQANRVQRRVSPCQSSSRRPVISEATAKAKGRVNPTRPR